MTKRSNNDPAQVAALKKIKQHIVPFHPPVFSFENKIGATPFQTLIAVLLSSRTRDQVTQAATQRLFEKAATPRSLSKLPVSRIAKLIYPVGFYRQKAIQVRQIARTLSKTGNFPDTLEELTALPGVGRKTANLVLALAFGRPAIAVDTHVFRISKRLGWAKGNSPREVEEELQQLFPRASWKTINQVLVGFGQTTCRPQNPLCQKCVVTRLCIYFKNLISRAHLHR